MTLSYNKRSECFKSLRDLRQATPTGEQKFQATSHVLVNKQLSLQHMCKRHTLGVNLHDNERICTSENPGTLIKPSVFDRISQVGRIIKSNRMLLEWLYKTKPHSKETFQRLHELWQSWFPIPCDWPWSQWRIFHSHRIWTSPNSVSFLLPCVLLLVLREVRPATAYHLP